jgi:thioredoxin 1
VICAQWCGVCRELQRAAAYPSHLRVSWADVDDLDEFLDHLEVESFPTLALRRDGHWVYWGASKPSWPSITRTVYLADAPLKAPITLHLDRLLLRLQSGT